MSMMDLLCQMTTEKLRKLTMMHSDHYRHIVPRNLPHHEFAPLYPPSHLRKACLNCIKTWSMNSSGKHARLRNTSVIVRSFDDRSSQRETFATWLSTGLPALMRWRVCLVSMLERSKNMGQSSCQCSGGYMRHTKR